MRPERILILAGSEEAVRRTKDLIAVRPLARRAADSAALGKSARVETLLGFCRRVLEEYALSAGVNPGFSVLAGMERRSAQDRMLDDLIDAGIGNEGLALLVSDFGPEQLKAAALGLYRQLRRLGLEPGREMAASATEPEPYLEAFERCFNRLAETAEDIGGAHGRSMRAARSGRKDAMKAARSLAASSAGAEFDWHGVELLKEYQALFQSLSGPAEVVELGAVCASAVGEFISSCIDRQSALYSEVLLDLVSALDLRYSAWKKEQGVLDDEDMLSAVESLLSDRGSEAAQNIRERYRLLILDTSYDLGPVEQRIVAALTGRSIRPHPAACGRLSNALDSSDRNSIRIRPGLARFINLIFGELCAESGSDYEHVRRCGTFAGKRFPDVEFEMGASVRRSLAGDTLDGSWRDEAVSIAGRILEMTGALGSKPLLHTVAGRKGVAVELRDIMVLVRSPASLGAYKRALDECGVRVRVVGCGLYEAPEVRALIHLLEAVDNPLDDNAMAAVLLSPIAGVSNSGLRALRGKEALPQCRTLWDALHRLDEISGLGEQDLMSLQSFLDTLECLLEMSSACTADILEAAIERTDYSFRLLMDEGGGAEHANVRKLCDTAAQLGAKGLFGVSEFLAHIRESERLGEWASDALAEDSQENAVLLAGVRGARRLRRPVVFLAEMSRRFDQRPERAVFDPVGGLVVQVRNPRTLELETSICHREVCENGLRKVLMAERERLMLALTRAEEHLVLLGHEEPENLAHLNYCHMDSWSAWVRKALNVGPDTPEGRLSRGKVAFRRRRVASVPPAVCPPPAPVTGTDHPIPASVEREAVRVVERCRTEPPAPVVPVRLSVTRILDYLDCPARFRMGSLAGLPRPGLGPSSRSGASAADVGQVVHELLSRLDFTADVNAQIDDLLSIRTDECDGAVENAVRGFARSRWCEELRQADRVLKEVPFELMVDGWVLAGRIDTLYHKANGWTVLDYKTGRAEARERYELQVGMYALVVSRLLDEMPSAAALVLLSIGEEWAADTGDGKAAAHALETAGKVAESVREGKFGPKPGKACQWCIMSSVGSGSCRFLVDRS